MPHVLCKLSDVELSVVQQQLQTDAAVHAEQGMVLEHLWQDADHRKDVYFLFRVTDLAACQERMKAVHAAALEQNPMAKLPKVVFLAGQ